MLPSVLIGHPEVERVQLTDHCLERFRSRYARVKGRGPLIELLVESLEKAEITTRPPLGISSNQPYALWAVNGKLAFPLVEEDGKWVVPTCLVAK